MALNNCWRRTRGCYLPPRFSRIAFALREGENLGVPHGGVNGCCENLKKSFFGRVAARTRGGWAVRPGGQIGLEICLIVSHIDRQASCGPVFR